MVPLALFSPLALKNYWLTLYERAEGRLDRTDHILMKSLMSIPINGAAFIVKVIGEIGYFEIVTGAFFLCLAGHFGENFYFFRPIFYYWRNWQLALLNTASVVGSLAAGLGIFVLLGGP